MCKALCQVLWGNSEKHPSSTHLLIYLSIYSSVYPSIHLFINPFIHLMLTDHLLWTGIGIEDEQNMVATIKTFTVQ